MRAWPKFCDWVFCWAEPVWYLQLGDNPRHSTTMFTCEKHQAECVAYLESRGRAAKLPIGAVKVTHSFDW